ncbi:MAG: hypothetical protein AUK35_10475 [Zetaproteobacteria bacterium CG2_30_46_52]|nr:MAG: hypothetical protein AUK35_10475 [Zetaproteobacteria bacterium CG2_30_46_52]
MKSTTAKQSSAITAAHLQKLFMFRNIVIIIALLVVTLAVSNLHMDVPLTKMLMLLAAYVLFNIMMWLRPFFGQMDPTHLFFIQLIVDVCALTAMLYLSGGASNPFVSLFLLPLVIVAAMLPKPYIWSMAMITIAGYGFLMTTTHTMPGMHPTHSMTMNHTSSPTDLDMAKLHMPDMAVPQTITRGEIAAMDTHILGMWFSFLFSVAVVLFFIVSMAETLRQREKTLHEINEKSLRDAHVVALGTLAAGAAHELGTPLATMAVLTKEMQREYTNQPALLQQIDILRSQVNRCKTTISQLSVSAGHMRADGGKAVDFLAYFKQCIHDWQTTRPQTHCHFIVSNEEPSPSIVVDETLTQALLNLLDNAAEASPERIEVYLSWSNTAIHIHIRDFGAGVNAEILPSLGKPFLSTKQHGQGLGYYLAKAVFDRLGGHISINNHKECGAYVDINLPLLALRTNHDRQY